MGLGGHAQRQSVIPITPYQEFMLLSWLITIDVNLDHLAEVVLPL